MGTTVQVGQDMVVYWNTGADGRHMYSVHKFASGNKVGLVNNLSYTVDEGLDSYHGVGRRFPWGMKGGAIDVTLHLEGLWIDSGAQEFILDQVARTGALLSWNIGFSGTEKGVVFSGCRIASFDANFDADGWATQTVDFGAIMIG